MNMAEQRNPKGFNKKATLLILVVSLVTLVAISYALPLFSPKGSLLPRISVSGVDIIVTYRNGTIESKIDVNCTRTIVAIISVFDVMVDNFQISYEYFPAQGGYIIKSINNEYGWMYEVDGVTPQYAVDVYPVGNNSIIRWKQV